MAALTVSVADIQERIEGCGILADDEQDTVRRLAAEYADGDDAKAFVQQLVSRELLTAYQARKLWNDRGGSLRLGNYVVEDELGRGGMGVVLRARHVRMRRQVAVKVLPAAVAKDADVIARFQREVQAGARLEHPNIVTAHDADEVDGRHILVMQLVDGEDLATIVKRDGPMSIGRAVDCVVQAARGLAFAHRKGVVHRDVKPANLLLDRDGTVKVLDLGLARFSEEATARASELTGTGTVMGTVDYMSPEQAHSTRSADERSDVYSLGYTLWYLLTGRPAYQGDSMLSRMMAHATEPIPSLQALRPDVPAEIEDVYQRMVAKEPGDRIQTMGDVIAALETIAASVETNVPSSAPVATPVPPKPSLPTSFSAVLEPEPADPFATEIGAGGRTVAPKLPPPPSSRKTPRTAAEAESPAKSHGLLGLVFFGLLLFVGWWLVFGMWMR